MVVQLQSGPVKRTAERRAFTLIEMLVVIAIIGILAGIILPTMHTFKPNPSAVAGRQLLDDIARARQYAISQRTTVYMVFVPTNFWQDPNFGVNWTADDFQKATNLMDKQLVGYNFVVLRRLGDQPGRGTPRYLSTWKTMPDGTYIPYQKFWQPVPANIVRIYTNGNTATPAFQISGFQRTNNIPFPADTTPVASAARPYITVPYVAFDYLGRLTSGQNELIPVTKGSVIFQRNPTTGLGTANTPQLNEVPPGNTTNTSYNIVSVDWLTGRAHLEHQEVR